VSTELSESELERYAEQIDRIGVAAQQRLKETRAIVLGARAAGSAAAAHLVSSGVGYVAVVDGGAVERADLCGQSVLYTPDIGANRAEAVAAKLGILNTNAQAESYPVHVEKANAQAILAGHDLALDCRGGGLPLADACDAAGADLIVAAGGTASDGLQAAEQGLQLAAAPGPVSEAAPA
jgi:molybdopterin/thiamine biosynthesis adenylyltransferase